MNDDRARAERARLAEVYDGYRRSEHKQRSWDASNRGNQAIRSERVAAVRDMLERAPLPAPGLQRVIEVGCGEGGFAEELITAGVPAGALIGVEIDLARLTDASPILQALQADGVELPLRSDAVDLVVLSTVLSSIKDDEVRRRVLLEGGRVVRAGGAVLIYDIRLPNPRNREVVPVRQRELTEVLAHWHHQARSVTVLPQLARHLGPATRAVYPALARIGPLRSHRLHLLRKPLA